MIDAPLKDEEEEVVPSKTPFEEQCVVISDAAMAKGGAVCAQFERGEIEYTTALEAFRRIYEETWKVLGDMIVREAIKKCVVEPMLEHFFPGQFNKQQPGGEDEVVKKPN